MRLQIESTITINADAQKIWTVLAHDFVRVSNWASVISASRALPESPELAGAPAAGRICVVRGFGETHEALTHYDEQAGQFSYRALKGLPSFVHLAENTWSVQAQGPGQARVISRAIMDVKPFPGMLLAPLLKLQLRRLGRRTFEELKYFIERNEVHPRKAGMRQGGTPG